jgi:hypothetical protein
MVIAVVAFRLGHMTATRSFRSIDVGADRDRDGEINVLESLSIPSAPPERPSAIDNIPTEADFDRREQARRTFQQLKQLEKMKNDGMITSAEYSSKRTELLRES